MTTTQAEFVQGANFFIDFGQAAEVTFPNGEVASLEALAQAKNTGMGVRLFPATITEVELLALGWKFIDADGEVIPLTRVNQYFHIYNTLVYGSADPVGEAEGITVTFPNGMTDSLYSATFGCDNGEGVELFEPSALNEGFRFTDADGDKVSLDRVNACITAFNMGHYEDENPRGSEEDA